MKTIFIAINRGLLARNILRTDILKILKAQPEIRIVIFVPEEAAPDFREEFKNDKNIIIEGILRIKRTRFRKYIFQPLLQGLVLTDATKLIKHFGTGRKRKLSAAHTIHYYMYVFFFGILSKFDVLKRFFHWLECKLYPDKEYEIFFDKYSPDLIFTTTVFSLIDVAMNKTARRRGIISVGMAKSWDNLDKYLLQANPDKMLTQNEYLYNAAIKYQLFKPEDVTLVGFPQFDIYTDKSVFWPKEKFCQKMGIPLEHVGHKIILFCSEGHVSLYDEDIVDIIFKFMQNGELKYKCCLIVRPHPLDAHLRRFDRFKNIPDIYINDYEIIDYFPDHWKMTAEETISFANVLYHSDVTINSFSTLALDAVCLDKPIINLGFDGYQKKPLAHSVLNLYKKEHYKDVMDKKATRLAKSAEELKNFINMYLSDPSIDHNERAALQKSTCYLDGHAGRRVAESILLQLGLKESLTKERLTTVP